MAAAKWHPVLGQQQHFQPHARPVRTQRFQVLLSPGPSLAQRFPQWVQVVALTPAVLCQPPQRQAQDLRLAKAQGQVRCYQKELHLGQGQLVGVPRRRAAAHGSLCAGIQLLHSHQ